MMPKSSSFCLSNKQVKWPKIFPMEKVLLIPIDNDNFLSCFQGSMVILKTQKIVQPGITAEKVLRPGTPVLQV